MRQCPKIHFQELCSEAAWQEIDDVKNQRVSKHSLLIFGEASFDMGLQTIFNAIVMHFALKKAEACLGIKREKKEPQSYTLTLVHGIDGLWMHAKRAESANEQLYLQNFR